MESSPQPVEQEIFENAQKAIEQRRVVLGPCLAAMGFTEHGGSPPELPQQLQFDGQVVELESWEREVLLGQATGDTETLLAHLAEGIAFQARCLSTLRQLEIDPPQPDDVLKLGSVIEEAAVGLALQEEIQRDIDRLVGKGEMTDAKRLTAFRCRIVQGVSGLKKSLGDDAQEQAEARSAEMLTPRFVEPAPRKRAFTKFALDLNASKPVEPAPAEGPAIEESNLSPEELFEQGLHDQEQGVGAEAYCAAFNPARKPDPARRFRFLLGLLAVVVVAYAIFLSVRPEHVPVPDRLGIERFQHLDGVLHVRPRPPSLFVKLDAKSWAGLSPEGRLGIVEKLGRIAGGEGYFGVAVRTSDGKTVGQWLKKTGAELTVKAPSN